LTIGDWGDCLIGRGKKLPPAPQKSVEKSGPLSPPERHIPAVFASYSFGTVRALSGPVNPQAEHLKERAARQAERVVRFVRELPNTMEARRIGGQLLDAATAMSANYRAACRARSHAEFVAKLGTVVEESVKSLLGEADELLAIFTASHKTASGRPRHRTATNRRGRRRPILNRQ
jgi:four helix bundle protein